jgi:hypothetical protein
VRNHATGRTYRNLYEVDRITFRGTGCLSALRVVVSMWFFPWGTGSVVALMLMGRLPRRRFLKGIAPLLAELDQRAAQLRVAQLRASMPLTMSRQPPVTPQAPTVPGPGGAGWHHDPSLRHQYRYFDGTRWTEHVNDQGRPGVDPI